jgi:acyl-CoA thioester hydrolase
MERSERSGSDPLAVEERITYRGVVHPWHCDHMGHMNVMWYVGKFDEATWQLFCAIGLTPSFMREANRGMAAVDQHISYIQELHAGDVLTIRSRVIEVRAKSLRFVHEMCNDETGQVVARTTLKAVHLDLATRKSCDFPAGLALKQMAIP